MRSSSFSSDTVRSFFLKHIIATMAQLKKALGTSVDMTIYRQLKQLSYRSSYSHQGKFYTLDTLTKFDDYGLWQYKNARFSKYGTLVKTGFELINQSEKGVSLSELRAIVGIDVKETLYMLYKKGHVEREKIEGRYVYFSNEPHLSRKQHLSRIGGKPALSTDDTYDLLAHEIRAAIILFFSLLDERQRRLYAGLESLRLGHGGDSMISRMLDIDTHTVARGRRELLQSDIQIDRIRQKGGGRHPIKKNSNDY